VPPHSSARSCTWRLGPHTHVAHSRAAREAHSLEPPCPIGTILPSTRFRPGTADSGFELDALRTQLDKGATPKAGYAYYTVRQAAQDWLAHGLDGRSPKTVTKNQNVLEPILKIIGARKLRDLTAADVRQALAAMAAGYSTTAVSMGHLALKRAIRHAEAGHPASCAPHSSAS
jgi:hypothetical protein